MSDVPLPRPRGWLACLLPLLLLPACLGAKIPDERPGALTRIVDSGTLRVGMTGEQPPLNMTARSGDVIGMEVALVRVLARAMKVEPEIVVLPFGRLLDALEVGEVDLVMSGVTINPERIKRVDFVGPYFTSGKSLLTRSKELAEAASAEELDSPELRVAALRGSTSEEFVRSSLPRANLVTTDFLEEAIAMIKSGELDALVADRETCSFAVLRFPEAGLVASSASFTLEPIGIALPKAEPNLLNLLNTYLTSLESSGALDRARSFWFENSSWVKDLR